MWQGVIAPDLCRQAQWEGVPGTVDQGVREGAWEGALAFANLGLPGTAVRGSRWPEHKTWLQSFVADVVSEVQRDVFDRKLLALLLCEVGNLSDRIVGESRKKFCAVIMDAIFKAAHAHATIVWAPEDGETMAAFLPYANMTELPRMTHEHMPRVSNYRVVDRFIIQGAPEHGSPTLLVYNQHQPASKERPFPNAMRISFCKYILIDAMDCCRNQNSNCVGFVFGGDANCGVAHWNSAIHEVRGWNITFNHLAYLQGRHRKPGDFMVAGCVKHRDFVVYENTCRVQGREKQHDPMVFKFSYKPRTRIQAHAEEPPSGGALASGATEHAAAPAPNIPLHDSWTGFDKDNFVSKKLEPDLISEADYEEAQSEHDASEGGGASDAEDASDAAEEAQLEEAEHFDELGCIGFALAKSVSFMGGIRSHFQNPEASAECLDAAWMKPLVGACSQTETIELSRCMDFVSLPDGRCCRARPSQKKIQPKQGS